METAVQERLAWFPLHGRSMCGENVGINQMKFVTQILEKEKKEKGGNMFLRNVGIHIPEYTLSLYKKPESQYSTS
jgi:hypothetical protein